MKVRECLERLSNGASMRKVAEELNVSEAGLRKKVKNIGFTYENDKWTFEGDEALLENELVFDGTRMNVNVQKGSNGERKSKKDEHKFTEDELKILKELIDERENDRKFFRKFRIYENLRRVPVDVEQVRRSYSISKETIERFEQFAKERRLPMQDLVELALIQMLDSYE